MASFPGARSSWTVLCEQLCLVSDFRKTNVAALDHNIRGRIDLKMDGGLLLVEIRKRACPACRIVERVDREQAEPVIRFGRKFGRIRELGMGFEKSLHIGFMSGVKRVRGLVARRLCWTVTGDNMFEDGRDWTCAVGNSNCGHAATCGWLDIVHVAEGSNHR
jgi:hypothetical protein